MRIFWLFFDGLGLTGLKTNTLYSLNIKVALQCQPAHLSVRPLVQLLLFVLAPSTELGEGPRISSTGVMVPQ